MSDELMVRARALLDRMPSEAFAECAFADAVEGVLRECVNRLETYQETEGLTVANANRAWGRVKELRAIVIRTTNPLLPGSQALKAEARALLARMEKDDE